MINLKSEVKEEDETKDFEWKYTHKFVSSMYSKPKTLTHGIQR